MSSSTTGLVVFCRRPAVGIGKQRLARQLGAQHAFTIASALLDCALEDAAAWPGQVVLSPADCGDVTWASAQINGTVLVEPQPEGNLGERLNAVDRALRARGHDRLLFIGTDAPSLAPADLAAAARMLDDADVVLGPAADGGVTLMGSRVPWPDLARLPWSEQRLGTSLEACCRKAGLTIGWMRASYDVDELADLAVAVTALLEDSRPARRRLRDLLSLLLPQAQTSVAGGCTPGAPTQ